MGKEWYHLTGGIRSSSSSSSSYSCNSKGGSRRGGRAEKETSSSNTSSSSSTTGGGCMSAVFQLFDFHHQFHFPHLHHQPASLKFPESSHSSFPDDEKPSTHVLKGTEAPRNSLELDHDPYESPLPIPSSSILRKDEHLLMQPAMGIQIKTSRENRSNMASSPEISSSPGTKTPTLVVRLMGLDLLPDSTSSSPRPSSTLDIATSIRQSLRHGSRTPHHGWSAGRKSCSDIDASYRTRSLPETPRVSLGRRSDVDHRHRPSLQINKENTIRTVGEDFNFSLLLNKELRCSSVDGTTSNPRHYARQIVKQVKERVSRKVGMIDITNTIRSRSEQGSTKDQISKPKKPPRSSRFTEDSSPPCSPRLRFPDTNRMLNTHCPEVQSGWTKPTGEAVRKKPQYCSNAVHRSSCLKLGSLGDDRVGRPPARLAATEFMRNKQEDPFVRASKTLRTNHKNDTLVDKKCKTTSSGIRKREGAPTTIAALPVKKDPSPPATKIPHKQVHDIETSKHGSQLPIRTSHRYRHEATHVLVVREKYDRPCGSIVAAATTATHKQAELQYVSEILRCAGIEDDIQLSSFTGWFSPSHPLHPSIFSGLKCNSSPRSIDDSDNAGHHVLDHPCNRKLVFQLVDELLADFLKPHLNNKPWINMIQSYSFRTGSQLIGKLRTKIESFPRANCQVLEDIDAIIDGDLPESEVRSLRAFEEEGGAFVSELERDIWEDLVREVVTEVFAPRVQLVRETY